METDKRSLETIWNRWFEPLLISFNGYSNIQCRKEAVSYRFNDLLSCCRTGLSIYRIKKAIHSIIHSGGYAVYCFIEKTDIGTNEYP